MNIQYPVDGIINWGETIRNNFHEIEDAMVDTASTNLTLQESTGYGVINGLNTYAQATPNMTVGVLNGTIHLIDGSRLTPLGSNSVTIEISDATNPRKDIIYLNNIGEIVYLAGTPLPAPNAPIVPSGGFLLSEIYVGANVTSITSANITDKRKFKNTTDSNANKIGVLNDLPTIDKTSLVNAIKENTQRIENNSVDTSSYIEVVLNSNQTIPNGVATLIPFNTVSVAYPSLFELQADGSIKVLKAGTYEVSVSIQYGVNSVGSRSISIYRFPLNIARAKQRVPATDDGTSLEMCVNTFFACLANDTINVYTYQSSGGGLDIIGNNSLALKIRKI